MKQIALLLIAAVVGTAAMAQSNNRNHDKMKGDMPMQHQRFEFLDLTAEQKVKMKSLNETFQQQMKSINKDDSQEVQKTKRTAILNERHNAMLSILTPQQKEKLDEKKKDFKGKEKWNKKENRLDDYAKKLNLTSEQSAKIAVLNADLKTRVQSVNNNNSLNENEKKSQIKTLFKKHRVSVSALLTNEQKEKFKNSKQVIS